MIQRFIFLIMYASNLKNGLNFGTLAQVGCLLSEDSKEGLDAVIKKRKPEFHKK